MLRRRTPELLVMTKVKPHFDSNNFYQHDLTTKFQWKGKKESCALNKIFGNNKIIFKRGGNLKFQKVLIPIVCRKSNFICIISYVRYDFPFRKFYNFATPKVGG